MEYAAREEPRGGQSIGKKIGGRILGSGDDMPSIGRKSDFAGIRCKASLCPDSKG